MILAMPSHEQISQLGQAILTELEHIGGSTAPIACIRVNPTQENEGLEFVFVMRTPFNHGMQPSSPAVNYVRYRLPLGRLAEATPGNETTVTVEERIGPRATRTGRLFEKVYSVRCKDLFRVSNDAPLVDAVENSFIFPDGSFNVPSLREWLSRPAEEVVELLIQPIRRRADKFELADLAIVDQKQGEIWRLDIRKFIVIAGAPGTGKTTTAIKRIAQKTDYDALINAGEVPEYPSETLKLWLQGPTAWVFFTPTELLRNYLHEALAKEGLAATEEHVPVWATARQRIALDVLHYIGQNRFLSLRHGLVATRDSKHLMNWAKGFFEYFKVKIQSEPAPTGLEEALESALRKIPIVYQEYRLRAAEGGNFYHASAMGSVNDKRVDPIELDSLIYTALKILRESIAGRDIIQRAGNTITQRLINEFRYVVAVDEATDFSSVELACMRLLSHPAFDCTTFTGDLMQRMTSEGIKSWDEIGDLVNPAPEIHHLKLVYRQSPKLLQIAAQLYQQAMNEPAPFLAGYAGSAKDPDPLWLSEESNEKQANWITKRIGELHRIWDESLPIAVFVPSEADVVPTAELLRTLLFEDYGITVEACLQGLILGTQANVRVFSIQFIKGLEFEAVFFLGADSMATVSPELVDKFLYVGLTRARSFLAVITRDDFPQALSHVQHFFKQGTWEHLVPTQNPNDV
jgi:hypothetical protein